MNVKMLPTEIIIDEANQIYFWCNKLNCKTEDLLFALRNVGNNTKLVDLFLILNRRKIVSK